MVCMFVFFLCIENNVGVFFCNPGTTWAVVDSPSPDVGAIHVAVGVNVVWAVTKDNKVRKCCDELRRHTIVLEFHIGIALLQEIYLYKLPLNKILILFMGMD